MRDAPSTAAPPIVAGRLSSLSSSRPTRSTDKNGERLTVFWNFGLAVNERTSSRVLRECGASVDRQVLTSMAESTGGRSYDARTRAELESAYAEIGNLERSHLAEQRFTSFREFAPWVAGAALTLLVVEHALRATWLRRNP